MKNERLQRRMGDGYEGLRMVCINSDNSLVNRIIPLLKWIGLGIIVLYFIIRAFINL